MTYGASNFGRGPVLPALLLVGLATGMCAGQDSSYDNSTTEVEVDDVRVRAQGLEEAECVHLAKLARALSRMMVEDSGHQLFGAARQIRIRNNPDQSPNYYVGGTNSLTFVVPDLDAFRDGRNGDAPGEHFALLAVESCWTRIVRPIWSCPHSLRYALNRVLLDHYRDDLVEEFGEQWWFGRESPDGTLYGLPSDHPLIVDMDRSVAILERVLDEVGVEVFLLRVKNWNDRRLPGKAVTEDLQAFVLESLQPGDGQAPPAAGEGGAAAAGAEDAPIPEDLLLCRPVEFVTEEPWEVPSGERIDSFQYHYKPSASITARFWYGDAEAVPEQFVSVRDRDPVFLLRRPEQGRWQVNWLDVVLRRSGVFTDEFFYLVVMDRDGREMMRWAYPVTALPTVEEGAGWRRLGNTAYPYLEREYLVGLEFPELGGGQDIEIGVWPGRTADHAFWAQTGRRVQSVDEPWDFAFVLELRANEVNFKKLNRNILRMKVDLPAGGSRRRGN